MLRLNRASTKQSLDNHQHLLEKMQIFHDGETHDIIVMIYENTIRENKIKHFYFELDSVNSFLSSHSNARPLAYPMDHYVSKNHVFALCSLMSRAKTSGMNFGDCGVTDESTFCDLAGLVNLIRVLDSTETAALAEWLRYTVNALPLKSLLSQVLFTARHPRLRFGEQKRDQLLAGYVYFASSVRDETDFKIGAAFDLLDEIYRLNFGRLTDPLRYEYVFECKNRFLIFEYVKIAFIVNELQNDFFVIKNHSVKVPFVVEKIKGRYDK